MNFRLMLLIIVGICLSGCQRGRDENILNCHGMWQRVDTRDDLSDLRRWRVENLIVLNSNHVAATFRAIDPRCSGVSVEVTDSDNKIVIELLAGQPPESAETVCSNEKINQYVKIKLPSRIGSRLLFSEKVEANGNVNPLEDYLGQPLETAQALARKQNRRSRPLRIDDQTFGVTADYIPRRLNFTVQNNIVIGVRTDALETAGVTATTKDCTGPPSR